MLELAGNPSNPCKNRHPPKVKDVSTCHLWRWNCFESFPQRGSDRLTKTVTTEPPNKEELPNRTPNNNSGDRLSPEFIAFSSPPTAHQWDPIR